MKQFLQNISIAPKVERPFPDKAILWGSQDGGKNHFPTVAEARSRIYADITIPLREFGSAVAGAQERIWIVDDYLFISDGRTPKSQIDQILIWLPLWLAATDIRFLTKSHLEVTEDEVKKLHTRALDISNHQARPQKECRIEVRMHLKKDCNFIHDRFAIVDDELWHFGGTIGGLHSSVSAASRGWRAVDHGAISFFEEIWSLGDRK